MNRFKTIINFFKKPFFTYGIFWSWNFIFIILLIFSEVNSQFLFTIIKNAFVGYTPIDYSLYSLFIFLIPIGSVVLGITFLRKKPLQLMKLFYGVEIPLCLLFILRLSVFRELTSSTFHLFILLFLGMISFLFEIVSPKNESSKWLAIAQKIGHSLLLIIGLYIGLVLIFYSIPLASLSIKGMLNFEWSNLAGIGFFGFIFFIFFIYSTTLVLFLPISIVSLYIKAFIRNYRQHIPKGKIISLSTLGINVLLLFILNFSQPQTYSFESLDLDFSIAENKQQFIENTEEIKKGLLNAYLSQYRYISSIKENNHINEMYQESFNLSDNTAKGVQNAYNFIMSPFLYNGERYEDAIKAQELYEKYFDGSIQKLEKETILKSMKSTWDNDGIEAGLLNVNQEKVLIKKQEITINEKNDIAEIEIYEVYQSQSFDRQEIFYYFSLPQNSVITGLWLSDDDEKKKYAFNVSPRGAAQKVYQQEVQRRVDPSLLEQVGPNQYRLRAFPIEPKTKEYSDRNSFNDFTIEEGSEFHLWLSYKTLINADNEWELPKLLEKRNVYWSDNTELIINNKKVNKGDSWLPKKINTNHIAKIQPHTVQISASTHIKIEPKVLDHSINLENKKIMLLIDGSYSMLKEQEYLLNTLLDFENKGFKPNNINCLIINESIQKYTLNELIKKIENNAALFFGTTNYMNIVNQFKNSNSNSYDAIIILSDKGNYESSEDTLNAIQLNTPLSILHISEQQTPIYNDAFLETIQNSDGHIVRTVNELIDQMNLTKNSNLINYENSIMYSLINTPINKNEKYFSELASQSFIKSLKITADRDRVEQLDQIHQIALREQIVTPYSSMIVLVNESQKEELRKAELEADRFDREVESGDEVIIDPPNSFNVSGTPEPHEWILIGLVLLLLIFRYYQANIKLTR